MESIQSGTVTFEGKPVIHSQRTWIPGISYIFQHYHLIEELTVAENITLPARMHPHRTHGSIQMLAEALNLQPLLSRIPTDLSGGERQRVAIARALITQPTLLLADEPTGSLDEETGTRVMDLLLQTCNTLQTALILVTHNNAFARRTQRHWELKNRQLHEAP
jgi:ABC-type lipoprotein export system ATPase subunit